MDLSTLRDTVKELRSLLSTEDAVPIFNTLIVEAVSTISARNGIADVDHDKEKDVLVCLLEHGANPLISTTLGRRGGEEKLLVRHVPRCEEYRDIRELLYAHVTERAQDESSEVVYV